MTASELRPMKVVRDAYDNAAVVSFIDWPAGRLTVTMLAGSDFGRLASMRIDEVERQIAERPVSPEGVAWARRRWAELQACAKEAPRRPPA